LGLLRRQACARPHHRKWDGNDLAAIDAALRTARAETQRPSLILARTHLGYGEKIKNVAPNGTEPPCAAKPFRIAPMPCRRGFEIFGGTENARDCTYA